MAATGTHSALLEGLSFNTYYTWSKSMDYISSDPGSTAGSGKPDTPNTGFVVQGNQRNLKSNRALRTSIVLTVSARALSMSFRLAIPHSSRADMFGFVQLQSGTPFSITSAEPEVGNVSQYRTLRLGSGGLYRLASGRPSICGTIDQLRQQTARSRQVTSMRPCSARR